VTKLVPQILHFESLPSTNEEAAKRAVAGAPEGLCVVAAEQTAGRGRLQRTWVSPKNAGLYCSTLFRPGFAQDTWPLLTLVAAISVNDALLNACALPTDIKWPNDILVNDKKLCGILAETVETPTGRALVMGIGINLTKESVPLELSQTATSVEQVQGRTCDANTVLQALLTTLFNKYETLQQTHGAKTIVSDWCSRSSYSEGRPVQVVETSESFTGITRGLERDGALRVETPTGEIRVVRAGDVTHVRPG